MTSAHSMTFALTQMCTYLQLAVFYVILSTNIDTAESATTIPAKCFTATRGHCLEEYKAWISMKLDSCTPMWDAIKCIACREDTCPPFFASQVAAYKQCKLTHENLLILRGNRAVINQICKSTTYSNAYKTISKSASSPKNPTAPPSEYKYSPKQTSAESGKTTIKYATITLGQESRAFLTRQHIPQVVLSALVAFYVTVAYTT